MTPMENVYSERSANVIPFPMASAPQSPADEMAFVHDVVVQCANEVEIWGQILLELRELLLVETLRLEAECVHLRPVIRNEFSGSISAVVPPLAFNESV